MIRTDFNPAIHAMLAYVFFLVVKCAVVFISGAVLELLFRCFSLPISLLYPPHPPAACFFRLSASANFLNICSGSPT